MQRTLKILSFICVIWVIFGGTRLAQRLPADSGEYVEKKYAGWSGVLRGWVYSDWECGGGFISWLNDCAADFERTHDGVYLEFEAVGPETLRSGPHPPQMKFSPEGGAVVAMGGYVMVASPDGSGTAILPEHCGPMIAMWGEAEIEIEEPGLDLGLEAMARDGGVIIDGEAFRMFMNGETGRTIVNQAQLAQLIRLRDAGRGPDWRPMLQGKYAWCDQLLGMEICCIGEEAELCAEFLEHLRSEESQRKLAWIGAFSPQYSVYAGVDGYESMEQQLQAERYYPKGEHSPEALGGYVRKLETGALTADEAMAMIAQTFS